MIPYNIISFISVCYIYHYSNYLPFFPFTAKIPKTGKNYFCRDHILLWCGECEVPCFHCTCLSCQKLPANWRNVDGSRCKICMSENYTPNFDDLFDPARNVKSLNKRFKKHISTDFGMYFFFPFFNNVLSYIFVLCKYTFRIWSSIFKFFQVFFI